jgi:hypothetical protein
MMQKSPEQALHEFREACQKGASRNRLWTMCKRASNAIGKKFFEEFAKRSRERTWIATRPHRLYWRDPYGRYETLRVCADHGPSLFGSDRPMDIRIAINAGSFDYPRKLLSDLGPAINLKPDNRPELPHMRLNVVPEHCLDYVTWTLDWIAAKERGGPLPIPPYTVLWWSDDMRHADYGWEMRMWERYCAHTGSDPCIGMSAVTRGHVSAERPSAGGETRTSA